MNSLHELIDKTEGAQMTEYDQYEVLDNFQARFDRVSFQNYQTLSQKYLAGYKYMIQSEISGLLNLR